MLAKRNTFESAHDMSDFSVKKNKNHGVAFQKDKFKPGGGKQRPGKDRRNQSKGGAGRSRRK